MCGKTLVTPPQNNDIFYHSGEKGFRCRCVYVMERIPVKEKFLFRFFLDRETDRAVIKYSKLGGKKFGDLVADPANDIKTLYIDPNSYMRMDTLLQVAANLGLEQ
jgi:succinyl-CoA synthetase beta subunit